MGFDPEISEWGNPPDTVLLSSLRGGRQRGEPGIFDLNT